MRVCSFFLDWNDKLHNTRHFDCSGRICALNLKRMKSHWYFFPPLFHRKWNECCMFITTVHERQSGILATSVSRRHGRAKFGWHAISRRTYLSHQMFKTIWSNILVDSNWRLFVKKTKMRAIEKRIIASLPHHFSSLWINHAQDIYLNWFLCARLISIVNRVLRDQKCAYTA